MAMYAKKYDATYEQLGSKFTLYGADYEAKEEDWDVPSRHVSLYLPEGWYTCDTIRGEMKPAYCIISHWKPIEKDE